LKINLPYLGIYSIKEDLNLEEETKNNLKIEQKILDKNFNPEKPDINMENIDIMNIAERITKEKDILKRRRNNNFMDKETTEEITTTGGNIYNPKPYKKKDFFSEFNNKNLEKK